MKGLSAPDLLSLFELDLSARREVYIPHGSSQSAIAATHLSVNRDKYIGNEYR